MNEIDNIFPIVGFVDGGFPTNKDCKYHCSPTCHPLQVDQNKWHYGCLHKAWKSNRNGDFCPFVKCDGDLKKCEISKKLIKSMISGKKRKITNAYKKIKLVSNEIEELKIFLKCGQDK